MSVYSTSVTRWYVDTRSLHPIESRSTDVSLPLLSILSKSDQENITRFHQPKDKLMSLASTLLKYLFIHQTARIPWSEIVISRWPAPHKRPYWSPPASWPGDFGIEFNVSHQAGLTALVGCKTPDRDSSSQMSPDLSTTSDAISPSSTANPPRLGVDITCTTESHRGPRAMTTNAALVKWIDIFSEMFSPRERRDMQNAPVPSSASPTASHADETAIVAAKLRRFYTCWSLKEAYIKMVGEGLLASWLRELEFRDVVAPARPASAATATSDVNANTDAWGPTLHSSTASQPAGFDIYLHNHLVDDDTAMELVAYGESFILATAMRGVVDDDDNDNPPAPQHRWRSVDFERDIRPCAEGRCGCLQ